MTTEDNAKATQDRAIALAEEAATRQDTVIAAIVSSADALRIETSGQLEASSDLLRDIKARQKSLTDTRLAITRPMERIQLRVEPGRSGGWTMDDVCREIGWIDDECRLVLTRYRGGAP